MKNNYVLNLVFKVNTLSVLDLAEAGDLPLFHNQTLDRRLGIQEIRDIHQKTDTSNETLD